MGLCYRGQPAPSYLQFALTPSKKLKKKKEYKKYKKDGTVYSRNELYCMHFTTTIAHNSNSLLDSLSIIGFMSRKKFMAKKFVFCILPRTRAYMLWAKGHSHKICPIVSSIWPHIVQMGSTCTIFWKRFAFVRRI